MSENLTLKELMQKNIQAYAEFVKNEDYEGGAEYFKDKNSNFEAVIYHAYFTAWLCLEKERLFNVEAFGKLIESSFKMYAPIIKLTVLDNPDFKESEIFEELIEIFKDLKEIVISFHEREFYIYKTEEDTLKRLEARFMCSDLHLLAFEVGDKIEEYFDINKAVEFWKLGCELMEFCVNDMGEKENEIYRKRKFYTDKIRQTDKTYPEYEVKYFAKLLEEKLEICKAEKKLKGATFNEKYSETYFIIPDGIEVIEAGAFSFNKTDGSVLEEIVIPKSVKRIEKYAFSCNSLKKVTIPADSELEFIGERAFFHTSLQEIKIPQNCEVGSNALFGCTVKRITPIDKIIQKITEAIKKQ